MNACRMPTISLVAWESRPGDFVFVKIPNERGRYLRTHVSVIKVACTVCNATVGEPCYNPHGAVVRYGSGTHADRRERFKIGFRGNPTAHLADLIEKPHFVYAGTRRQLVARHG